MRRHAIPPTAAPAHACIGAACSVGGHRSGLMDLEELCHLLIRRYDRLERLLELRAPEIIVRNEKRMLKAAVVALRSTSEGVPRPPRRW